MSIGHIRYERAPGIPQHFPRDPAVRKEDRSTRQLKRSAPPDQALTRQLKRSVSIKRCRTVLTERCRYITK